MEISTKKISHMGLVLKLNSSLGFLPPFTSGKKCLEFLQKVYLRYTLSIS